MVSLVLGVVNQVVLSVDSRLVHTQHLYTSVLRREGMIWFKEGEDGDNEEYLCNAFVRVEEQELAALKEAAISLTQLGIKAAKYVVKNRLWDEIGIPKAAIELVEYSLKNELNYHLINRFDFAGGIDLSLIHI